LFKNNKSCAEDNVVSEMLRVLDEDVLDLLADAIKLRILNREADVEEATTGARNSRFVQFPYDDNIDRRDGLGTKRRRNTVHVENGLTLSCVVDPPLSLRRALGLALQRRGVGGLSTSCRALVSRARDLDGGDTRGTLQFQHGRSLSSPHRPRRALGLALQRRSYWWARRPSRRW
jgi:hypothetical protein